MNRFSLPVLFFFGALSLGAQTFSTITISTSSPGASFSVDGRVYTSAANFNWPLGSSHTLVFLTDPTLPGQPASTTQTTLDGSVAYLFSGWKDNAGLLVPGTSALQVVTANPAITSILAQVVVAYRIRLNFLNSQNPTDSVSPASCAAPGTGSTIPTGEIKVGIIYIGTQCFWNSANVYVQANTTVNLNAFPYPGFVFLGWSEGGAPVTPYLTSITMTGPINLAPVFTPGKLVHFLTSPLGLQVLVDHTTTATRTTGDVTGITCPLNQFQPVSPLTGFPPVCLGDNYFAPGSTHVVAGVTPQRDLTGNWWVFSSWTNNVSSTGIYTADNSTANQDTVTATYVPGAEVSFITNPTGLPLTVDNRQNWPGYNFVWGLGTTHTVAAAATQTNKAGRQYTFQGWSNAGAASQTINVDQNAVTNGLRMIANYSVLSRIVIQSSSPSVSVMVDGTGCQLPCTIDRASGAQVHVTAQTQVPMGSGARLDFGSWSDGGASDHSFTVNQDYTTLTLNYTTSYQLAVTSAPSNGVAFQFNPASNDLFYPQNTQVSVTAVPNPGFKFLRWSGDLTGSFPSGVVTMSVPRSVQALVGTVPYIAPTGITNAVGATPNSMVGPGSLISIYGQGLAPDLVVGPTNPLAQAIAGVTVTINDQILGLLFVSPQQINAQVPSNLSDGVYTLIVHSSGQPDVSTTFSVARDSPGIFTQTLNAQQYALAMHSDGSLVTPDSPATGGETISVLGTGFGPYNGTIVDGFFPPTPAPTLVDSITVTAGGMDPSPTWAGAAPGYAGITLTQFQVPTGMPSGSSVQLKVTVNGTDSNTVMLPLQ